MKDASSWEGEGKFPTFVRSLLGLVVLFTRLGKEWLKNVFGTYAIVASAPWIRNFLIPLGLYICNAFLEVLSTSSMVGDRSSSQVLTGL